MSHSVTFIKDNGLVSPPKLTLYVHIFIICMIQVVVEINQVYKCMLALMVDSNSPHDVKGVSD